MKPLKIFFCDLTYDTIILVSDTIPINIGFIASYSNKIFRNKISTKLFKYPDEAIRSIKREKPDLICLSNYSWNSNLSEYIASIAKKANPDKFCLNLMGDGAFGMSGLDIETAVRSKLAITTIILNNGGMATYPGGFPNAREKFGVSFMKGNCKLIDY